EEGSPFWGPRCVETAGLYMSCLRLGNREIETDWRYPTAEYTSEQSPRHNNQAELAEWGRLRGDLGDGEQGAVHAPRRAWEGVCRQELDGIHLHGRDVKVC